MLIKLLGVITVMKDYTLQNALERKKSYNLSFIKFLASLLVIIGHAFPLTGSSSVDFLSSLTNEQVGLGAFAVGIFFVSSGLLISRSLERENDFRSFFSARIKRIFPPLMLVVFFSALLLGPFLSTFSFIDYFSNKQTWLYLLNGFMIIQYFLPGVFNQNPYGAVVNGSLWTLPVEFLCYILVFITNRLRLFNQKILFSIPLVAIGFILCNFTDISVFNLLGDYVQPVFIYYIGMLMFIFREKIILKDRYTLLMTVALLVTFLTGFSRLGMVLFFPYIIVAIAFSERQCSKKFSYLGNYSYGIYLVAFPIQQSLVTIFGSEMSPMLNSILSIFISLILSVLLTKFLNKYFFKKTAV